MGTDMIHGAVFHSSDGVYGIISSLMAWAHLVPQTGIGSDRLSGLKVYAPPIHPLKP